MAGHGAEQGANFGTFFVSGNGAFSENDTYSPTSKRIDTIIGYPLFQSTNGEYLIETPSGDAIPLIMTVKRKMDGSIRNMNAQWNSSMPLSAFLEQASQFYQSFSATEMQSPTMYFPTIDSDFRPQEFEVDNDLELWKGENLDSIERFGFKREGIKLEWTPKKIKVIADVGSPPRDLSVIQLGLGGLFFASQYFMSAETRTPLVVFLETMHHIRTDSPPSR